MATDRLDTRGRFVIRDFSAQRPFASFLPGIAGPLGIPMWAFYVNRGQGIASFGIESKDGAIVEFQPANKAYQTVPYTGFRTFLKIDGDDETRHYEPFGSQATRQPGADRHMAIGMNELEIVESRPGLGLRVSVLYFTLPGESFPGLVRQVTLENTGDRALDLEILDGLPQVVPYGATNALLKDMSRTLEAWMEVTRAGQGIPCYRLRTIAGDEAEVEELTDSFFYAAWAGRSGQSLPVLVDPACVFGQNTGLSAPDRFLDTALADLLAAPQSTSGKTPCGFAAAAIALAAGEAWTLCAVIGHARDEAAADAHRARLARPGYLAAKREEAAHLAQALTAAAAARTAFPLFDAYCRQSYLDNLLRGGVPVVLGDGTPPRVYHLYSRKHGDLERDYNAFQVPAEYYSQGNGSYRDVNQNRRDDVWFNPRVADADITIFMNLIQADGYNPLAIRGSRFSVPPDRRAELLALAEHPDALEELLAVPFTPGQLVMGLTEAGVGLRVPVEDFLARAAGAAAQHIDAAHETGYWVDHWTYNLDLIDSYLDVYPDRREDLLFGRSDYTFYDSAAVVAPRAARYVLTAAGPRQLNALFEDPEKAARIRARARDPHVVRIGGEDGEPYRTTLFVKLLSLALCKFATLDPLGLGIEMEAGRPGWYDALNGLPALFGSSFPETCELHRLLDFLLASARANPAQPITLPVEIDALLWELYADVQSYRRFTRDTRDFDYWDRVTAAREAYRQRVRTGFAGIERMLVLGAIEAVLAAFLAKVQDGIARALAMGPDVPPTYFSYTAEDYEVLADAQGRPRCDAQGRQFVHIKRFAVHALPPFLEGPVRHLRTAPGRANAAALYRSVRRSPLFDAVLEQYRLNASLAALPHAIGRARAFTPGWLENESIWLHMEYKYLLAILQAGLYAEFWSDARRALIPFHDPAVYGRSTIENSSFIVSSAHPDAGLHGAGFVARLSGATAEFLSMWRRVMAGPRPFVMRDGQLSLELQPALPGWLFDDAGTVTFTFLGACQVTYANGGRADTFGPRAAVPQRMRLEFTDGRVVEIDGPIAAAPYAEQVRAGQVRAIQVTLGAPDERSGQNG